MRQRSEWDLDSRIPLKVDDRWHAEIGDPDGFSGSPVFFIWQDATRQTHLGFAGIITHGSSSGSFQVYPTETIREIVNRIIDHPENRDGTRIVGLSPNGTKNIGLKIIAAGRP